MNAVPQPPSWRPDPFGRHQYRFHDGLQWTSAVADQGVQGTDPIPISIPPGQPALPTKPRGDGRVPYQSGVFVWGAVSAAALAIGSIGPWATLGPLSIAGTSNGRDGIITLILAGVAALVFAFRASEWCILAVGLLALATTAYDIVDLSNRGNALLSPSPGWGIILAAAAAVSLCIWPFVARNSEPST